MPNLRFNLIQTCDLIRKVCNIYEVISEEKCKYCKNIQLETNIIKRDYLLFKGKKKENIISIELVRLSFGKLKDPYRF